MRETSPKRAVSRWRGRLRKLLLVLASIAALYASVGVVMDLLIWMEIRRIRNEGDPVSMAELALPMPPDAENGALVYQKAFRLMRPWDKLEALRSLTYEDERLKNPGLWDQARAEMPRFAPVVELVRKAQAMPRCRFEADWKRGYFPSNPRVRELAELLNGYAVSLAHDGNPDEALRVLKLAAGVGDTLKPDHCFISSLIREGIYGSTAFTACTIVSTGPVSEKQAKAVSDALAWNDNERQVKLMLEAERAVAQTWFGWMVEDGSPKRVFEGECGLQWLRFESCWLGRPVLRGDQLYCLRAMRRVIETSDMPFRSLPKPKPNSASCEHYGESSWSVSGNVFGIYQYYWRRGVDYSKARINGAQVAIAACVYKQRFGTYSRSLSDLGKLGWKLNTEDPFSGRPFVYKSQANGFLLYSIGPDLKDDGGEPNGEGRIDQDGDIIWKVERGKPVVCFGWQYYPKPPARKLPTPSPTGPGGSPMPP